MKAFAISYLALLLLDAMLSITDNTTATNLHLSKWTTIILCITSLFVFIIAAALGLLVRSRPRWPLLVSSGLYTAYFAALLATAVIGIQHYPADTASQRARGRVVAATQFAVGAVCLAGLLRSRPRREAAR